MRTDVWLRAEMGQAADVLKIWMLHHQKVFHDGLLLAFSMWFESQKAHQKREFEPAVCAYLSCEQRVPPTSEDYI